MKKMLIGIFATALLAVGALAQQTAALEPQFVNLDLSLKAVQKLIDDKDNKISDTQAAQLLPYLREVRANSALTIEAAEFYAMAIKRLLSDKQLETGGLKPKAGQAVVAAGASADQGTTGGGAGGASASTSLTALTVASNPFLEGDLVKSLDAAILRLMTRAEKVQ